jgi:hypothetical protein
MEGGPLFVRALAARIAYHVRVMNDELDVANKRLKAWEEAYEEQDARKRQCTFCKCFFPAIEPAGHHPHECHNPETYDECDIWCGLCDRTTQVNLLLYCSGCQYAVCVRHATFCCDCKGPMCLFCTQQYGGKTHHHCCVEEEEGSAAAE